MGLDATARTTTEHGRNTRDWTAAMIGPAEGPGQGRRAGFVATTFEAGAGAAPVLHVSALGLYEVRLNGRRVGDDQLTPGWTCYDDRIAFQSYPLAPYLVEGENRIEIWLGDGWYRSPMMWRDLRRANLWGERVGAIAEVVEGEQVLCRSGSDWTSGALPITANGIYYGEDYDARLEGEEATRGVEVLDFDTALLVPHETGAVRELPGLQPVDSWTDAEGRTIFDFGQNIGGYLHFRVEAEEGAELLLEHAEVVGPNRDFDNRNFRTARAALRYTARGGGVEDYRPHFTFMGFRYARVTTTGRAELQMIEAVPISSVPELAGGLETGVPAVNRLVENTIWSQRGNFIEVPTDCPQRDERMGWTGDAQVFAGTACWLADSESFLTKYLRDVRHDQRENGAVSHFSPDTTRRQTTPDMGEWAGSTGWGDVVVIIPWQLYLHYGRKETLRESFPAMLKWLDYLWALSDGPVLHPNAGWAEDGFTFGDWLQPTGDNRKPRPTIGDDCAATIYHAISTDLTARIARILGETAEAERLETRAAEIRAAYAHEFITPAGRLGHNDQTSYALAFLYDLIPAEHHDAAKHYFRQSIEDAHYLIGTGFIGTPALLPALTKLGMNDLAAKVFLNRKVPGWLYQVEQGATTIWERWDAIGEDGTIYEPSMNSYNHYAYGAVCQWLFEDVAGVVPTEEDPGFDRVRLAPSVIPELGHVSMWHDCRNGRIEAGWRLEDGRVIYSVSLPEGCEGVLAPEAFRDLEIDGAAAGDAEMLLAPGRHELRFDLA